MIIGIDIRMIGKKRTGDEVVFFNLVKNLAKVDSENEYKLFTDITDKETLGDIAERLEIKGNDRFKIVSLKTPNRFAWNFWSLAAYLRKNPVDIYHTQYITPWFVPKKIKIVTIVHDISFNFFPKFIKWSDLFFLKLLIPISLKRADAIIAVSEFTKNEIISYYKIAPDKIHVAYNSIADEFFSHSSENEKESVRKKYALPEKYILYIGTLQPRKNIPRLIEAFARIQNRIPDVGLVIGGNKNAHNFDKRIDGKIKEIDLKDKVIFPGYIDDKDKAAFFAAAHVFAYPSLYEGFGIPILEAMSQDVSVVASDIKPLREVGGDGVLYADPGSLDEFSNMLYTACADDLIRAKLSKAAEKQLTMFSWKKTAYETLALYQKLLHN